MKLYSRPAQKLIEEALLDTPVVSILRPRQVGKSTLAKTVSPEHSSTRRFFRRAWTGLLGMDTNRLLYKCSTSSGVATCVSVYPYPLVFVFSLTFSCLRMGSGF